MRFLAIGEPTSEYTRETANGLMDAEIAVAQQMYAEHVMREGYLDESSTRAVLILDAADRAEAEAQLARYPMVRAELIVSSVTALTGLPAVLPAGPPAPRDAWWPLPT